MSNKAPGSHDDLAMAVGYALAEWTTVEGAIENLFKDLSGIDDMRAFYIMSAIVSFETRLQVVNTLMPQFGWDEVELAIWERLSIRVQKYHKKRHEIAHFAFFTQGPTRGGGTVKRGVSPFFSIGRYSQGKQNRLTLADVQLRREKFSELRNAIAYFYMRAGRRKLPPEAQPEETDLLRQLRTQVVHSLGGKTPPPQS